MKFYIINEQVLYNAIGHIENLTVCEDKPMVIEIKNHKALRTEEQNKLYWSWLRIISRETGNAEGDLHADFGDLFLPKVERKTRRGVILEPLSTTKLGVKAFTEYLKKIESEAATFFGICLPHPGEFRWWK